MRFGSFQLDVVRECLFKLDGGAMFGVVPKPMWSKLQPADEQNRVEMTCNLLVIRTAEKIVLVETGMGPRWSEKERERYGLKTLIDHSRALESLGIANDQVDAIIISHMHFDHIGGAVLERDGKLVPTFPRAKVYVQKGEYELAHKANARAKGSYRSDDFKPLEDAGLLEIIDGDTEIVPGVWAKVTGGHTSHHQVITWESDGNKGVFFADIIPTMSHLSPPWVMGYDHFPLQTCDLKNEWLQKAAQEQWLVVFDHEKGTPWGHVEQTAAGKFDWHPLAADTTDVSRKTVGVQ
jgi:glyoxylase-like metal-dependent hydrolase (beta-lactamase superfamily II)